MLLAQLARLARAWVHVTTTFALASGFVCRVAEPPPLHPRGWCVSDSPRHSAVVSVRLLLLRSGAAGLADLLHGQLVVIDRLSCGFTPRRRLLPLCFVGPTPWLTLVLLGSGRVAMASRSWLA